MDAAESVARASHDAIERHLTAESGEARIPEVISMLCMAVSGEIACVTSHLQPKTRAALVEMFVRHMRDQIEEDVASIADGVAS